MNLEKLCEANIFSSDLNFNTLIYSENDGFITFKNRKIYLEDDFDKKFIKFYPPDCHVFTASDANGLKVWDAEER